MNTFENASAVFRRSWFFRLRSMAGGLVLWALAGVYAYRGASAFGGRVGAVLGVLAFAAAGCLAAAGVFFIRRGLGGEYLRLGGGFVFLDGARYTAEDLVCFCDVKDGSWVMCVESGAYARQPFARRFGHQYAWLTAAAALGAAYFLKAWTPDGFIWAKGLRVAALALLFGAAGVRQWKNACLYFIDAGNKKDRPALAREITLFCQMNGVPVTSAE